MTNKLPDPKQEKPINHDFLSNVIPLDKKEVNSTENSPTLEISSSIPQHILDIEKLTLTELRMKYTLTYSSWKNMKSRKKDGYIIAQEFNTFKDFLSIMGPRTSAHYTLDRIDNDDNEYAPNKVEWRDKYAQNSNKGNNIRLFYQNEYLTIAQWASKTGQNPSTLYKRYKRGWADKEVILGCKKAAVSSALTKKWRFLDIKKPNHQQLETAYLKHSITTAGNKESRPAWLLRYSRERIAAITDEAWNKYGYGNAPSYCIKEYDAVRNVILQTLRYIHSK